MRIIASDYDGTLNYNGIDENKRNAIQKWRSAGNLFVLVTGRHAINGLELHQEQQFGCDYFVGSNGAVIMNSAGEVVHADCCEMQLMIPLLEYLFELGCDFALIHAERWLYIYPSGKMGDREPACTLDTLPEVPFYTQVCTWIPSEEQAACIAQKVKERFGDHFNPMQNGTSVDIVRGDVNKATGLTHLLKLVGARHEDMITVGDNTNDYHMIEAFRSYAMANGVQSIKELADFVTPSVTQLIEWELELANQQL